MKTAIIGGGISGLSAGFYIKKAGFGTGLKIYESTGRAGGTIATYKENGYILEAGPNGFLDSKKSTLELAAELGLGSSLVQADKAASRRYIYSGGKLHLLPGGPIKFLSSPLISAAGKTRILLELFVKAKKDSAEESVADFVRRRLGSEALDKLVGPMVSGIYAGDAEQLSLKSAFPRMRELETTYGSLIKAMIKIGRGGAPPGVLTSFKGGLQELIDALAAALAGSMKYESEVLAVEKRSAGWAVIEAGKEEIFDAVLFAAPAHVLGKIYAPVAELCGKIYYPALTVAHLGYKKEKTDRKIDGFGFLTARNSGSRVLGVIFASNLFRGRAPGGFSLLTAMIGGATGSKEIQSMDDKTLASMLDEENAKILGMKEKPDFIKIIRHEKAIPNYNTGYSAIKNKIEAAIEKDKGLFLSGNAFYGIGVNDSSKSGKDSAERVINYLRGAK